MDPIYKQFTIESFVIFSTFFILTFAIYFVLDAVVNIMLPYNQYDEPIGSAVKVLSQEDSSASLERIIKHWRFFIEFRE